MRLSGGPVSIRLGIHPACLFSFGQKAVSYIRLMLEHKKGFLMGKLIKDTKY